MLTLNLPVRPVTTAFMAAAQAGSARRLGALQAVEADLDPNMALGLAFAFLVKTLARHRLEGPGDAPDRPLPLSFGAVEQVVDTTRKLSPFDTELCDLCS